MREQRKLPTTGLAALTLIELLVVLSVVAALAVLFFGATGRVRSQADRTVALQNMRTIGTAIYSYAADHDARLPGPLWPGQMPMFDPARSGRLVKEVAGYLPIPVPDTRELEPLFIPPAYRKAVTAAQLENARTFVMNMKVATDAADFNPWGSLVAGEDAAPARLAKLPRNTWGLSDADQRHPRVVGASWAANTPEEPIHQPHRLAWYFDGSVGNVEPDALR